MNSKKSQSQVITTVLLILITISLVVVISSFAISFVKEKLSESDCTDIIGKVEIRNNPQYTCYNEATDKLNIQVHIGDIEDLEGFTISVDAQGSSNSYEIKNNTPETNELNMYTEILNYEDKLLIPGKNSEKTYTISSITEKPETINIYPILKDGKTCNPSDTYKFIANCLN
jgi:flagellin-like protein